MLSAGAPVAAGSGPLPGRVWLAKGPLPVTEAAVEAMAAGAAGLGRKAEAGPRAGAEATGDSAPCSSCWPYLWLYRGLYGFEGPESTEAALAGALPATPALLAALLALAAAPVLSTGCGACGGGGAGPRREARLLTMRGMDMTLGEGQGAGEHECGNSSWHDTVLGARRKG